MGFCQASDDASPSGRSCNFEPQIVHLCGSLLVFYSPACLGGFCGIFDGIQANQQQHGRSILELNVSSVLSSITSMSLVATSLTNLSVPVSATGSYPTSQFSQSIPYKELFVVVIASYLWGPYSDNKAVIHIHCAF